MRRRLVQGEDGMAMIISVIVMFIVMGFGGALLMTANAQRRSSFNQQGDESAFALAQAALNAQVYELSLQWPTAKDAPQPNSGTSSLGYLTSCTAASAGASYCPSTSDFSTSYTMGAQTCPPGTQGDAWNPGAQVANGWTTYVRDAGPSPNYFASVPTEETASPYDASASGSVWVRAVGIVNCHMSVVVSRVSDQMINVPIPSGVLTANGFSTSNNGQKIILNTIGGSSSTSAISVRCNDLQAASTTGNSNCTSFVTGQIEPSVSYTSSPSSTLSAKQLLTVKELAIADGTYYGPGSCPTTMPQLQGAPVYVDGTGCGTITITGNGDANDPPLPSGFLVVVNAPIDFEGTGTYYGVIYDANALGSSGNVVTLGGNTTVIGGVVVDGNGMVNLGSSGNGTGSGAGCSQNKCGDLEYNLPAFSQLQGYGGAAATPNSFRELPDTQ